MNKIYLSLSVCLMTAGVFAQGGNISLEKAPSAVHAKQAMSERQTEMKSQVRNRSTIWTDDFSGTATWTTTNSGTPSADWVIGSTGPSGSFSSSYGTIMTTGNFAMFDSDALGSNTSQQDASIFTGPIDLSGDPTVTIEFNNFLSQYQGTCYVIASTDGTNWTQFEVNSNVAVNSTSASNPELLSVNLTSAIGGSSTAYIGFQYVGQWDYAWMVDDVCLVTPPNDELVLSQPAFSDDATGINYYLVPDEQAGSINNSFTATITNNGSSNQAGTQLEVVVSPLAGGAPVATLNGTSTTLNSAQTYDDSTLNSWALGTTIGDFQAVMNADYMNSANDATPGDNLDSVVIKVTDFVYARDRQDFDYDGGGLWNGDDGNGNTNGYVMANEFVIYNAVDLTHVMVALNSNTAVGALIKPQVYEIDGGNFNLVYDAPADYVVTSSDLSSGGTVVWVEIPIDASLGGKLALNANTGYLIGFEHYGGPNAVLPLSGGLAPEQTCFLYDPTATTGGPWFFTTNTPSIRGKFDPNVGIGDVEASNLSLGQNAPNPFNENAIVNYSLNEAAYVTFEITDLTGKVVSSQNLGKVAAGSYTLDLNANSFSKGVYFYSMTAGKEKLTKRMVITK